MAIIFPVFALHQQMPFLASHPNLFDMKGTSYSIDFTLSNLNTISPLPQHEGSI